MTQPKTFKEFGIKPDVKSFSGEKINIEWILNAEITVHDYKIKDSKFPGEGKCLHLQITFKEELRVVFSSSIYLMDMIERVSKENFPFATKIVKDSKRLLFT